MFGSAVNIALELKVKIMVRSDWLKRVKSKLFINTKPNREILLTALKL
jgi:hypothetical protein